MDLVEDMQQFTKKQNFNGKIFYYIFNDKKQTKKTLISLFGSGRGWKIVQWMSREKVCGPFKAHQDGLYGEYKI